MATTISTQDIVDVKTDIDDIGKAVNEKVIVSPRYGEDFKSLPMIAAEAQATIGEWESAIALITQDGGVPALAVSDASGVTQQEINDLTGAPYRVKVGGYNIGERVILENGDIVRSTVDGNIVDPNVDMTGWVNPEEDQRKINDRRHVSPFDFGYSGGDDDYGYYLQLAIDSGKIVKGSPTPVSVKSLTPVFINDSDREVDLSMINMEWLGTSPLYNSVGNRSIGVVNIRPEEANKELFSENFLETIAVSIIPLLDSNIITLDSISNIEQGEMIALELTYPTGTSISYRPCTVESVDGVRVNVDYRFSYVPTSIKIHRLKNICENISLKMPHTITDNSNTSSGMTMVGGCSMLFSRNCSVVGTNLINGAYPSLFQYLSTNCEDFNFKNTKPRVFGGGQGYTIQENMSTFMKHNNPVCIEGRHVMDWTCSAFSKCYNPKSYRMQQVALTCHGQYEHDCEYINPYVDDCSHMAPEVLNRAVSIANSGAEFGFRAKRIIFNGGYLGGAIGTNPNCEQCSFIGGIEIDTTTVSTISPLGDIEINLTTKNTGGLFIQTDAGIGNATMSGGYIESLDLRHGVDTFTAKGTSEVFNLATSSTIGKPNNIVFTDHSKYTVDFSPNIEVVNSFTMSGSARYTGTPTTRPTYKAKNIVIGDGVELQNSAGITSTASEIFSFSGKCVNPQTGRATVMILHSGVGTAMINNASIKVQSASVPSLQITGTGCQLVLSNSSVEGITNIPTSTAILKSIVVNNFIKDDTALKAATTSGSKVFQNNI